MRHICECVLVDPACIGALLVFEFLDPLFEDIGAVEQSAWRSFGLLEAGAGLLQLVFHIRVRQVVDAVLGRHEVDGLTFVLDHACSLDVWDIVQSVGRLLLILIEVGFILEYL